MNLDNQEEVDAFLHFCYLTEGDEVRAAASACIAVLRRSGIGHFSRDRILRDAVNTVDPERDLHIDALVQSAITGALPFATDDSSAG